MHQIEDAPSEKRWTIMAAMLGANMAFALFQGIEQQNNPNTMRLIALVIIVVGIPFQAVWFMIQAFIMEYSERIEEHSMIILLRLNIVCQLTSYLSISGIGLIFFSLDWMIGIAFTLSALIAIVMVRLAMSQAP
ncbi:MAG: hypothetical protein ACKVHH_01590 [Candidatus Poseidoniales archaeon]|jgi:hypothetical protein|tara:strand:- start:29 stop:430 length:402 start_codon:yes stop_codon:yes gene_type:complete